MIQLCNRAVLTHREDGSTDFFESETLQKKIESSCRAAGLKESWIAEDIALSVEFSLGELGNDKIFTNPEIDAIVVKILQEAGLGSVAAHYRHLLDTPEAEISFLPSQIKEIVSRYLHVDTAQLDNIVEKVTDAGQKLLLENASPTLILELAKHYMDDRSYLSNTSGASITQNLHSCPWLILRDTIVQKVSGITSKLVSADVLKVAGVSRLFPSIRIEIAFANFAEASGLIPPVTDFIIFAYLANLAEAIDNIITIGKDLALQLPKNSTTLPVYLKFTDAPKFTNEWLGGNWNESKTCFEELVTELQELLTNDVFSYS